MEAINTISWKCGQLKMMEAAGSFCPQISDWCGLVSYVSIVENDDLEYMPVLHVGLRNKDCVKYINPPVGAAITRHLLTGKYGFVGRVYDDVLALIRSIAEAIPEVSVVFDQMGIKEKEWEEMYRLNFSNLSQKLVELGVCCYKGIKGLDPTNMPKYVVVVRMCSDVGVGDKILKEFTEVDCDVCPIFAVVSLNRELSKSEQLKMKGRTRLRGAIFESR